MSVAYSDFCGDICVHVVSFLLRLLLLKYVVRVFKFMTVFSPIFLSDTAMQSHKSSLALAFHRDTGRPAGDGACTPNWSDEESACVSTGHT